MSLSIILDNNNHFMKRYTSCFMDLWMEPLSIIIFLEVIKLKKITGKIK